MTPTARSVVRRLARSPGLAAIIVLTLGLGIGANVALFSLVRGVLLRPLPYPEAERLVRLWETNPEVDGELHGPSPLNLVDWMEDAPGFESMAAWYLTSGTMRTDEWVEEVRSAQVTADFFRVLGVQPALGRDFLPEEVTGYGPKILSDRAWRRLFDADPSVIGRRIVTSGEAYEIVGVMPPDFTFPDASVDAWTAWDLRAVYADRPETRTWRFMDGIGRMADGESVERVEAGLQQLAAGLAAVHPVENRGWSAAVTSLHDDVVGHARGTLLVVFGGVLLILLIACANVANLLLARVPARSHEIAIRTALGASRSHTAGGLLAESLVLAAAAAGAGLAIGWLLLELLVAVDAGRIPRLDEVRIDGVVFAFTVLVSLATAVLFGLVPAVQTLRDSTSGSLRHGARSTGGRAQRRVREALVAGQVAVALVLLTGAGLFVASLQRVNAVDPGLDPEGVATFRVSLDPVGGGDGEVARYYEGLLQAVSALPGVVQAGAAQTLPMNPVANDFRRPYRPVGSSLAAADAPAVQMRIVTPGYVEAMGMTVLDGTSIPATADLGEPLVAVVNQTLAQRLWPDGRAVGEALEVDFREGWQPYTVVGVVRDVKHDGLRSDPLPEIFLAHRQVPYLAMSVAVRTNGDPQAMMGALESVVRSHRPMQPAHDFVTVEELLATSTSEDRFLSMALVVFAAIALVLAITGVYGVMAYSVSHRRREIGVRMALGADGGRVVRDILGGAAWMASMGVAVGLLGVFALGGAVEGLLFGVEAGDPALTSGVAATLVAVAVLAAWVPARRAAVIAPAEALEERR